MEKLTFKDFRLLQRISELVSLSTVARELGVPTSQVSRALMRIEKACGCRLVHRSTHGLAMTTEGEALLGYCRRISDVIEELEGEFASRASEVGGLVRVAASSVIAEHILLGSLGDLGRLYPKLRVNLIVSDQAMDMTRDGIDIAIRTSSSLPDNVVARQIGVLSRALYAAPSYVAHAGLPKHPSELRHHRLVTNSDATHLNRWAFKIEGATMRYSAEGHWQTSHTGLATDMVLRGLGIGRLASLVAEPLVREGRLLPVLADCLDDKPLPIYAVTASTRQRLPKIKACVDFWSERMREQLPEG